MSGEYSIRTPAGTGLVRVGADRVLPEREAERVDDRDADFGVTAATARSKSRRADAENEAMPEAYDATLPAEV